ncbi:MAG: hypothetical protein WC745_02110 [Patescibacteria group bacterium]|jgi:tRNA A37 threonylcarbamoyladenosine modification protein TsaB
MILRINTIKNNSTEIEIGLRDKAGKWIVKKYVKADRKQAEKLLPLIEKVVAGAGGKKGKTDLKQKFKVKSIPSQSRRAEAEKLKVFDFIESIEVVNQGGTFTSLRIGVATANALGYALNVPVVGVSEFEKVGIKSRPDDAHCEKFKVTLPADRQESPKSKVNFDIVAPEYDKEPNITLKVHNP